MTNTINFKTSSNCGDIIYSLSGIKAVCERQNAKANIYIWLDRLAASYPGATHPVKDITGKKEVGCNLYMFKMLKPLLEAQLYVNLVDTWNGEQCIDLDKKMEVRIGHNDLRMWDGFCYPDMICDPAVPAITLPDYEIALQGIKDNRYILVNHTERYLNQRISYFFLKDYPEVMFTGTPKEFNIFKKEVPHAFYIQADNFLALAQLIRGSVLMIGNQSMNFAIAEQIKHHRVLEVCAQAPNVNPAGPNAYPFIVQTALESIVANLWKS